MKDRRSARVAYYPDRYYARRALSPKELLPVAGIAVGAGMAAFYLAKVWLERMVLDEFRPPAALRDHSEKKAKRERIAARAERERERDADLRAEARGALERGSEPV